MVRDPRFDLLFQPVKIGPVTARNRFYQVPHCTGMGWLRPHMVASLRGTKAEGGWGVVCTEYCSLHASSDDLPHPSASLWDDKDIKAHALMTDQVHAQGSLAGVELWYGGARTANLNTREISMDVASLPNLAGHPYQTRAMDKSDIRALRLWHRQAALRAKEAGFDIVYVYATHGYLLSHFLSPVTNNRSDEYGGSLENRVRLVRELIEETKEAVGDRCAVAVRFSADEKAVEDGVPHIGEKREMFALLAELPDLWDINIADYSYEMGHSRFVKEAALEPYVTGIKALTSKPVVTVGRFTSPETMLSQVRRGIVDFIGAARPSIADPFLPQKIEQGRLSEIRECIGCNVCYSGDSLSFAIRCTQNPTLGEEWRRGWHPERIAPKSSDAKVLIVGAGPAGLEAARALGQRGYKVMLAEARRDLGGRVTREAALPGLSEWIRVRDYRVQQLESLPNVELFRESHLTADDIVALEPDHVALATGATWRRDCFDGNTFRAIATAAAARQLYTPDDIMEGRLPSGPTLLYDADEYYLGSVIAERLRGAGLPVTYVMPSDSVARWSGNTGERWRVRSRLMELGVTILPAHELQSFDGKQAVLSCSYRETELVLPVASVVLVGQRQPHDSLWQALQAWPTALPFTVKRLGDCDAPAIIAAAVYSGHRYARELEAEPGDVRHDKIEVR